MPFFAMLRSLLVHKVKGLIFLSAVMGFIGPAVAQSNWYPVEVDVWEPPFNRELKRLSSNYSALGSASKPWRICTSIPHLKDNYWLAVNYGLVSEARRLGVSVKIFEAGGYENLDVQRRQIQDCLKSGADALIVSSISASGLTELIDRLYSDNLVIIDLINGMNSDSITARVGVDFKDNGALVAQKILDQLKGKPARVAWFAGPEGATWADRTDQGFVETLKGSAVEIVASLRGDTGSAIQRALVRQALEEHGAVDYIAGTGVTAVAAIEVLRSRSETSRTKVLSFYYGPGIDRAVKRSQIIAAPTDSPVVQARIAIDLAVKALQGEPYPRHLGPKLIMVEPSNHRTFKAATSLPPKGFRPIFNVSPW